jgi:glutamate dehydrogenase (NAD(P)+)
MEGARVVIQGSGNVGGIAGQYFHRAGAKVIGISDSKGGQYNPKGLDIDRVLACKDRYQCLLSREVGGEDITNEELLELECDILVPAALENQITGENAPRLRCRMVVEGANGPTTPDADAVFFDRGIFVAPDILANAGGVTVSYFEWVQNLQNLLWDEEEISKRLERIMTQAFAETLKIAEEKKVHMRTAAYILGVGRVAKATELRGIYP